MIQVLTNWILGIVTLAVILGVAMLGFMIYELFYEDYFLIIFAVMFLLIPLAVGTLVYGIHEWYLKIRRNAE